MYFKINNVIFILSFSYVLINKLQVYYFISLGKYWIKISEVGGVPHGPVVKIPHFQCRVSRSIPTQWTKTLEAASCGQKRKKKKLVSLISQFKLDGVTKHSLALVSISERSIPFPNT